MRIGVAGQGWFPGGAEGERSRCDTRAWARCYARPVESGVSSGPSSDRRRPRSPHWQAYRSCYGGTEDRAQHIGPPPSLRVGCAGHRTSAFDGRHAPRGLRVASAPSSPSGHAPSHSVGSVSCAGLRAQTRTGFRGAGDDILRHYASADANPAWQLSFWPAC